MKYDLLDTLWSFFNVSLSCWMWTGTRNNTDLRSSTPRLHKWRHMCFQQCTGTCQHFQTSHHTVSILLCDTEKNTKEKYFLNKLQQTRFHLGVGLDVFLFKYIILPHYDLSEGKWDVHGNLKPTYHTQWLLFYSSYRAESLPFPLPAQMGGKVGRLRRIPLLLLVPRVKNRTLLLPLFLWVRKTVARKRGQYHGGEIDE